MSVYYYIMVGSSACVLLYNGGFPVPVYYYIMVGSSACVLLYNGGFQCLYITI